MANHTPEMVELLPCPFCGRSAAHGDGFMPLESITYVWCSNEDCYLSPVGREERLFGIDEWNTRSSADVATITAQRDELLTSLNDLIGAIQFTPLGVTALTAITSARTTIAKCEVKNNDR